MSERWGRFLLAVWAALGTGSIVLALVEVISASTAAANVVVVLLGGTASYLMLRPPEAGRREVGDD